MRFASPYDGSVDLVQWMHNTTGMPTLVRLSNCQIIMRTRDHRPAHVHVLFNDGREALVYLADLRVAARQRVSAKEIADALEWISKRKAELIAQFEELRQ